MNPHPLIRALDALGLAAIAFAMVSAIGMVVALIAGDKPGFSLLEQGGLCLLSSLVLALASRLSRELRRRESRRVLAADAR